MCFLGRIVCRDRMATGEHLQIPEFEQVLERTCSHVLVAIAVNLDTTEDLLLDQARVHECIKMSPSGAMIQTDPLADLGDVELVRGG
jgi:hypothetical protein